MLNFTAHKLGETVLFRCAGRFISGDFDRLRDAIRTQSRARTIVLDLAEISTVDAAGVGMLVSLRAWAQATGSDFKLMNLAPRVEEVLEITHLRSVLEICSVSEMLDLLCEAIAQTRSEAEAVIDMPERLMKHVGTVNRTKDIGR